MNKQYAPQPAQPMLPRNRVQFQPAVRPAGMLQRKCACGGTPGPSGECEACRQKREAATLQRRASHAAVNPVAPPIVHEVLRSPGQPLDTTTRSYMEQRFGHDFSHVRVHAGSKAAESAQAVNALAYTVGRNVVFGADQYRPYAEHGRKLLAHELTHTLQQGAAHSSDVTPLRVGEAHSSFEQQATQTAQHVTGAARAPFSPSIGKARSLPLLNRLVLQRACDQPESFYQNSPRYCLDKTFSTSTHAGKNCYREIIPSDAEGCPPGDHCCFAPDGTVEDSRDTSSLADGKKDDGSCSWKWSCVVKHTLTDFLPAVTGLDCFAACQGVPGVGKFWCLQSCHSRKR